MVSLVIGLFPIYSFPSVILSNCHGHQLQPTRQWFLHLHPISLLSYCSTFLALCQASHPYAPVMSNSSWIQLPFSPCLFSSEVWARYLAVIWNSSLSLTVPVDLQIFSILPLKELLNPIPLLIAIVLSLLGASSSLSALHWLLFSSHLQAFFTSSSLLSKWKHKLDLAIHLLEDLS